MAASTYVVSATCAGRSAIVAETTAKTYATAAPAILTESVAAVVGPGVGTGTGFAIVLA